MNASPDPASVEEFGPYIVYERLGLGGMATVHRAKKTGIAGFERGVALKRMLSHLAEDAGFVESFVREAKVASLLVHPNIAQIYDFGRIGGIYYIAMEHVDGFDVRRLLRHANRVGEPIPMGVVLSILAELCDALEYAHTFPDPETGEPIGIVHRDISPSNLIVANTGHLKVIDFGIAKASSRSLRTESGRVKGKLGYMSPEAAIGNLMGPVSDMFSVGVVAHELLTARPLFSSRTDFETMLRIREGEIYPPSRRNPLVPPALDEVVLAALSRDPLTRLQSAGEMRAKLDQVSQYAGIRFNARDVAEYISRIPRDDLGAPSQKSGTFGTRPASAVRPRTSSTPPPISPVFTPHPDDDAEAAADVWADDQPNPLPADGGGDFSVAPQAATAVLDPKDVPVSPKRPSVKQDIAVPPSSPYQSESIPSLAKSPHVVMLPSQDVFAPLAPTPRPPSRRLLVALLALLAIVGSALVVVLAMRGDRAPTQTAALAPDAAKPTSDPTPPPGPNPIANPTPNPIANPTPPTNTNTNRTPKHPTMTTVKTPVVEPPTKEPPKPVEDARPAEDPKTAIVDPTTPDAAPKDPTPTPRDLTPKRVPLVAATAVTKLAGEIPTIKTSGDGANADVLVKVCIDEAGRVTSATVKKASAEIAAQLSAAMMSWRYKPYQTNGAASAVCFPLSLRIVVAHD